MVFNHGKSAAKHMYTNKWKMRILNKFCAIHFQDKLLHALKKDIQSLTLILMKLCRWLRSGCAFCKYFDSDSCEEIKDVDIGLEFGKI